VHSIAATKLSDLFTSKSLGETVNVHVVESVTEPQPDFAAMKRLIESDTVAGVPNDQQQREREKREIPKVD
jgi:hypothetical protein